MFKKKPKTAQQKAQRAQLRIFARLACCAYIVFYVVIPLIRETPEENGMNPTLMVFIVSAFIAIVAVIVVLTIIEIHRSHKSGLFKAEGYTDDEENPKVEVRKSESSIADDDDGDDEYIEGDEYDELREDDEDNEVSEVSYLREAFDKGGWITLNTDVAHEFDKDFESKYAAVDSDGRYLIRPALLNFVGVQGWYLLQMAVIGHHYIFVKNR